MPIKRSYISPEFTYTTVSGSNNMQESRSFMGSKMAKIQESIILDNRDIVYYENNNNEQIDITVESLNSPTIYSISDDKLDKHTIKLDETQSEFSLQKDTKWIFNINIKELLINYIFSKMKEARSFNGILNSNTLESKVDISIRKYIDKNIFDRYEFESIDLYVQYNDILGDVTNLRYNNTWNTNIPKNETTRLKKIDSEMNFDKSKLTSKFSQQKNSDEFNFDYTFDIRFKRI